MMVNGGAFLFGKKQSPERDKVRWLRSGQV